jgi:hypothetical protein
VVAKSFECIQRSNLVGMGLLPLQFKGTDSEQSLGLKEDERIDVIPDAKLTSQSDVTLRITRADGTTQEVTLTLHDAVMSWYFALKSDEGESMQDEVTINATMSPEIALQLAQVCKRCTFDQFLALTEAHLPADERATRAHQMIAGVNAVSRALADAGFAPR